ncbi:hypothetical protein [Rhizobacter fulvus]
MNNFTVSLNAERFLQCMHSDSVSDVGTYMLIRAHMLLSPDHRMTRAGIHAALRTSTFEAMESVEAVIAKHFRTQPDGSIYSPDLDDAPEAPM